MRSMSSKPLFLLSCLALLASCTPSGGGSLASSSSTSNNEISSQNSNKDAGSAEKISSEAQNSGKQEPVSSDDSENDSRTSESEPQSSEEPILSSSEEISSQDTLSSKTSSSASTEPGNGYPAAGGDFDNSGFTIARSADGLVPEFRDGAYLILEAGSYDLSGVLLGMVYVDVPEGNGEVELNLNGVTMSYASNSVLYCASADKLEISAKKGTINTILDLRAVEAEEDESQGGGALYSKVDTKLKGTGELQVTGTYNNGIHVTKDLEIQKLSLTSKAINNAIKGTDSLTINSGTITAISTGGDALKTADSDVSSKGKQRGDIALLGGTIHLYSACDGAQAAHDFILGAEDDSEGPTVTIKTNKYSTYTSSEDIASTSTTSMYLRMTSKIDDYRYAAHFYNEAGETGSWADATFKTTQSTGSGRGGRRTYYIYELERPTSYSSFTLYAFHANTATNSTTDYVAKSSGSTINASRDMIDVTLSGTTITLGSWGTYAASQQGGWGGGFPGGQEGNKDKADVSAKGIKANNDIYILSGTLDVTAYDDGLHANYGEALDSGETSTGDVYIKGGQTTIAASDDGVHAERYLRISGESTSVTVTSSYEGLEGNQIYMEGGKAIAYASNDAVNAGNGENSAGLTPVINVSSGHLFAAVPSNGDTDGIDSNGNYVQTGGEVICAGPNQSRGSAALDTDGSVTVNGGSLLVFGNHERQPSLGSGVTSSSKSGTYGNAAHTVSFASGAVEVEKLPNSTYSILRAYSVLGSISRVD